MILLYAHTYAHNPLHNMQKARQLFDYQQYLQCVNHLIPRLEKRSKMSPRDHFEHVFLYGVALLEYGIQYTYEYKDYQLYRQDYEEMVAQGFADYAAIPEIRKPAEFIYEALQALYTSQQLLCTHFPYELHQQFAIGVHIIRCYFLLESNNISAEIDRFMQFLDTCGEYKWRFEKYSECLAEIATFCYNYDQARAINQELAWYWREQYCSEQGKRIWRLFYVKYGTRKAEALQQECQKYL